MQRRQNPRSLGVKRQPFHPIRFRLRSARASVSLDGHFSRSARRRGAASRVVPQTSSTSLFRSRPNVAIESRVRARARARKRRRTTRGRVRLTRARVVRSSRARRSRERRRRARRRVQIRGQTRAKPRNRPLREARRARGFANEAVSASGEVRLETRTLRMLKIC